MSIIEEVTGKTELENIIREATRRIVSIANPLTVLLFGSAARGETTPDSDLDFLVIVKPPVQRRKLAQRIYRNLHGLPVAVDVIVVTSEDMERYQNKVGTILPIAHSEGRVVYESTG